MIRITPIRVIGSDGEQVGIIETPAALRMAEGLGMDLVEISPDARPPVCKIMDYGKFKYETSKNESKNKSKGSELKEIRLGRSVKIDPHDVQIRINQAREFLIKGHKVLVTQRFRGREMAHRELGIAHLRQFRDSLADIAKCESEPRFMGPQASIIMAPEKAKVEQYKVKMNKEQKAANKDAKRDKDVKDGKAGADGEATSDPAELKEINDAKHLDMLGSITGIGGPSGPSGRAGMSGQLSGSVAADEDDDTDFDDEADDEDFTDDDDDMDDDSDGQGDDDSAVSEKSDKE